MATLAVAEEALCRIIRTIGATTCPATTPLFNHATRHAGSKDYNGRLFFSKCVLLDSEAASCVFEWIWVICWTSLNHWATSVKTHPDGLITLKPAKTNRELQWKLVHNKIELPNLECKKNAIELPEQSLNWWLVCCHLCSLLHLCSLSCRKADSKH